MINPNKEVLQERAIRYRGAIIHFAISLELAISSYISMYFCGKDAKRMEEMISLVFADDKMTLNSKAQIFYYIASTYDEEWYSSYKSCRKPSQKRNSPITINNDLVYVIEERNVMTHRVFDNGEVYPDDENIVRFAKTKNIIEPIDYDDKKYIEVLIVIKNLTVYISNRVIR
jgi:hypothetical protein